MSGRALVYEDADTLLHGWLVLPPRGVEPRGGVAIAPTWAGLGDLEKEKAARWAELGWAALAADLYGGGKRGSGPEENTRLIAPFLENRARLADRMGAAVAALAREARLEVHEIFAAGYCFGGLAALELARSGSRHAGSISFHGLLPPPSGTEPVARNAPVLVLHGHRDPLAPPADVAALAAELETSDADWQIHVYGGVGHAFTNPAATDRAAGMAFDEGADRRSWLAMKTFIEERSGERS